jgi:hypothetical protein
MILGGALTVQRGSKYYNYLMIGAFERILKEHEAEANGGSLQTEPDEIEMKKKQGLAT